MGRWFRVAVLAVAVSLVAAAPALSEDVADEGEAVYMDDDASAPAFEEAGVEVAEDVDDLDAEARAAGGEGAVVRRTRCRIEERRVFRGPFSTSGRIVITPSGNVTLICHGRVTPRLLRTKVTDAIVIQGGICTVPLVERRTRDSHLVVTPSLHVHLICHIHPDESP